MSSIVCDSFSAVDSSGVLLSVGGREVLNFGIAINIKLWHRCRWLVRIFGTPHCSAGRAARACGLAPLDRTSVYI